MSENYAFINAIKSYYKNYFNFKGTADRSEFWYPFIYNTLIFLIFVLTGESEETDFDVTFLIQFVMLVLYFANIIPTISVTVRRLHDTNRSGWKALWGIMIPIGWIYLLICAAGQSRPNHCENSTHSDVSDDSKFCSSCGNKISKHIKFCGKCGIKTDESELEDELEKEIKIAEEKGNKDPVLKETDNLSEYSSKSVISLNAEMIGLMRRTDLTLEERNKIISDIEKEIEKR